MLDIGGTGVQTCALPISDIEDTLHQVDCPVLVVRGVHDRICPADWAARVGAPVTLPVGGHMVPLTDGASVAEVLEGLARSEERRVGKVGRSRWVPYHSKK